MNWHGLHAKQMYLYTVYIHFVQIGHASISKPGSNVTHVDHVHDTEESRAKRYRTDRPCNICRRETSARQIPTKLHGTASHPKKIPAPVWPTYPQLRKAAPKDIQNTQAIGHSLGKRCIHNQRPTDVDPAQQGLNLQVDCIPQP